MPLVWSRPHAYALPRHHGPGGRTARTATAGWGEFSPFLEYDDREALRPWWRAARRGGRTTAVPPALRDRDPGQRHGPGGRSRARPRRSCAPPAAAGRPRSRSPSRASPRPTTWPGVEAVRAALGPDGRDPHRRQRALGRRDGGRRGCRATTGPPVGWSTSSSRAPPSRSWPRCAAAYRRPRRRRRVDPARRGPDAGRGPGGRRHRRPQGAAARRGARLPRDRRADRPARRRVLGPRDLGRHRRWAWPWRPRSPSCRTPAASPPSRCSPRDLVDDRCSRSTGLCRCAGRSRPGSAGRRRGRSRDAGALVRQDRRRAGTRCEPVDRAGARARRRARPLRRTRGRPRPRVALGPARVRAARRRRRRAAAAARTHRRALGRLPRARAGQGVAAAACRWSRRRGTAAANLHPAVLEASESGVPLARADRRPAARAARRRRQPDRRPDRALRRRRAALPRGRRPRGAPRPERLLAQPRSAARLATARAR